ncbi:PREDICTED: transcription factor grauzone-like [Rhagoletis zephyria]|uniref:transcription factor grauzone-like n=1 Tax=Rhagoletis zephyria TaxID=28612 RepID=UPI0008115855|nr:PREDICTED: transcription factor grauzone-like [Rhagoletis zephyria]
MLCRLCLKESLCFLNIFDSDGIKFDIADILGRHFWFKPRGDDRMSPAICTMCWSKVYNFHQFYVTIEQAHSMLSASNVEKEFVHEYVGNEFFDNGVVKEEFSVTNCSMIGKPFGKESVGPEFIEIDDCAQKFREIPCSRIGKRNESMDLEFSKVDVNSYDFCEDPYSNDVAQSNQHNLPEQFSEIDIRDEECDKLNTEDDEHFSCFSEADKNRKGVTATEKKVVKLRNQCAPKTTCNEKKEISADTSLSHCDTQKTALLPKKSTEPKKNRKRLTRTKKKLSKLREKRNLIEKSKIYKDGSLLNSNAQEPALQKPPELVSDASLLYCNPQEPELHKKSEHVNASLTNCDTEKLSLQESTEPVIDASLSNCDALKLPNKYTKTATNSEKLTMSQKKLAELRLAELRQKRGKIKCNEDELVKKYISMSCDVCIFDCADFETLKKHYRLDHPNIKPYVKCCNRKFLHWLSIVHHAHKHDDPEIFKCQDCHKICADQKALSQHVADFHAPEKDKIFTCDLCPKKFARKRRLEIHQNLHTPMNERTFICEQCPNRRYSSNALLRAHIGKVHRRKSFFVCHVCGKEMKTKAFFEKHVRLHFEESGPKVKCTFEGCDSWLKDEDNLRLHIHRRHSKNKDKVFTCEVCGGEYKSRAAMTSHMLRVHPKKTYPCDICNKIFKTAWRLREHMAQHTGERNYKCAFCTSTFNTNGNYYTHLKNLHTVEYENWRKNNVKKTNTTSVLRLKSKKIMTLV